MPLAEDLPIPTFPLVQPLSDSDSDGDDGDLEELRHLNLTDAAHPPTSLDDDTPDRLSQRDPLDDLGEPEQDSDHERGPAEHGPAFDLPPQNDLNHEHEPDLGLPPQDPSAHAPAPGQGANEVPHRRGRLPRPPAHLPHLKIQQEFIDLLKVATLENDDLPKEVI